MTLPAGDITSRDAARLLGISVTTLYRWVDEGRIGFPMMREELKGLEKRPRGPRRSPKSKRYAIGRHSFS